MNKEEVRKEPLDTALVREYLVATHGDFAKVKQLVTEKPDLVHAVMNWGGDDWESGLGAAAHTGNRDIALWLLEKGARMDIFTAAMLGELEVVKAIIAVQPNALHATGPHGIPLIHHARMGKEQATAVYEYLLAITQKEGISQ